MAKGKKKVSSGGPHKKHGQKKKMWHCWDSTTRIHLANVGLLTKYYNRESWEQALNSRGVRNISEEMWKEFISLSKEEQKVWFKNHTKK